MHSREKASPKQLDQSLIRFTTPNKHTGADAFATGISDRYSMRPCFRTRDRGGLGLRMVGGSPVGLDKRPRSHVHSVGRLAEAQAKGAVLLRRPPGNLAICGGRSRLGSWAAFVQDSSRPWRVTDVIRRFRSEPGYLRNGNLSTIHYTHNPARDSAHMRTRASGSIPVDLI